jgi:hypothetical protein
MTSQSRRVAGIVLIVFPTVVFGGVSVLTLLVHDPTYADNALRQDLTPLVYLAYVGAALLVTGLLILGIGLLRARGPAVDGGGERGAVAAEGR